MRELHINEIAHISGGAPLTVNRALKTAAMGAFGGCIYAALVSKSAVAVGVGALLGALFPLAEHVARRVDCYLEL